MPRLKSIDPSLDKVDYSAHIEDLYRQKARALAASSQGLERYVLNIFGPDLIGSIAFAIDPWKKFENPRKKTALLSSGAPIIRTRDKVTYNLTPRLEYWAVVNDQWGYVPNNDTPYLFDYYLTGPDRSIVSQGVTDRGSQPALHGFVKDATKRTRPIGYDYGEFEKFLPIWRSGSLSFSHPVQDDHVQTHVGSGLQDARSVKSATCYTKGPELICDNSSTQALLLGCQTRALTAMSQYTLGLVERCLPEHRNFRLVYQIAELKDLPQTLRGTLEVWRVFERTVGTDLFRRLQQSASSWRNPDLIHLYQGQLGNLTRFRVKTESTLAQNASSAFLTFKFGWESMVQAISQMLPSPQRAARDVNLLISRIGLDQSFRAKRTWRENVTSFPSFSGNWLHGETPDPTKFTIPVSGVRNAELRVVLNLGIKFPTVDVPRLRVELYHHKLGDQPSASDIYDLIPWTWLIDWFGGLGDYVHLMDTISGDRSIVNSGFVTYSEVNDITALISGKFYSSSSTLFDGVYSGATIKSESQDHTGKLTLKYQLRRAIEDVSDIKSYWGSNLNPTQAAIIGALITNFGPRVRG